MLTERRKSVNFDNDENLDYQLNKIASNIIKEKRLNKGYSLEEVVKKMNDTISRQMLFKYENNLARMKNKVFQDICYALGLDPSDVWEEINSSFLSSLKFDNAELIDIDSDIVKVPVYGTIKAGIPIESQSDIIDYIDIPREWTRGGKKFYGLKISGDSMFPKYSENDIVIFEQNDDKELYNGKDCAVMINGTESTFKKVLLNEQGIVLQAYNMAYGIQMYSKEDVINKPIKIVGIAREKRTRL